MNLKSKVVYKLQFIVSSVDSAERRLSYDELRSEIEENPSMLLSAENINWTPPLGVIAILNGEFRYMTVLPCDKTFPQGEDIEVKCVNTEEVFNLFNILAKDETTPIYNEADHSSLIQDTLASEDQDEENHNEADGESGQRMMMVKKDLFVYHPELFDSPFIIRKGSMIPTKFLLDCEVSFEGNMKKEKNHIMFSNLISSYLKLKEQNEKEGN